MERCRGSVSLFVHKKGVAWTQAPVEIMIRWRDTDCYARAVTLQTCLTGQTNEGLGQFPQLSRGSPFSKEPSVLFFFFFSEKEGAVGLSQNAAGAVQSCQGGDTLDDAFAPSGRGEMSNSFRRSQVAGTGLTAVVVPLLLMFYTLMIKGLQFK